MKYSKIVAMVLVMVSMVTGLCACVSVDNTYVSGVEQEENKDVEVINAPKATPISGECGSDVFYNLTEDGTLTISGNGTMRDYDYEWEERGASEYAIGDMPWFEQAKSIRKIVVESGVESIGSYAFMSCHNLTEVALQEGLWKIDTGAFWCCYNLESVILPSSITRLENSVFSACQSLKDVEMPQNPDSEIHMGNDVFEGCKSLESITIPAGVKYMDMFYGCTGLKEVKLPNTVKSILSYAFSACKSLEELVLEDGCETIDDQAFSGCTALKKITIPDTVYSIHESAFEDCENLTIYAPKDSVAHRFAKEHNIKYKAI